MRLQFRVCGCKNDYKENILGAMCVQNAWAEASIGILLSLLLTYIGHRNHFELKPEGWLCVPMICHVCGECQSENRTSLRRTSLQGPRTDGFGRLASHQNEVWALRNHDFVLQAICRHQERHLEYKPGLQASSNSHDTAIESAATNPTSIHVVVTWCQTMAFTVIESFPV